MSNRAMLRKLFEGAETPPVAEEKLGPDGLPLYADMDGNPDDSDLPKDAADEPADDADVDEEEAHDDPDIEKAKSYLEGSLTVGQLIKQLEDFDENMPVVIFYPSGDYWRTQIAKEVEVSRDPRRVKWTDYHDTLQMVDDNYDGDGEGVEVVVLQ